MVKRLSTGDWFTAKVSACGLFTAAYKYITDSEQRTTLRAQASDFLRQRSFHSRLTLGAGPKLLPLVTGDKWWILSSISCAFHVVVVQVCIE